MSNRKHNSRADEHAQAHNRALRVLARMRRTGETLTAAARLEHVDPRTVHKYLGSDLRQLNEGGIHATSADGRRREMLMPTFMGQTRVTIYGSKQASRLGRYMSAVGKYLRKGDSDALQEFEGQSIAGHALITDPETLSSLAQGGALQLDAIYALPESSS